MKRYYPDLQSVGSCGTSRSVVRVAPTALGEDVMADTDGRMLNLYLASRLIEFLSAVISGSELQ